MKRISNTVFWSAILFIALTLFSLTIGQKLPYEFANYKLSDSFYDIVMQGLPVAILFTLFGTLKRENTKTKNWTLIGITILVSILSFIIMTTIIFSVGFGTWKTYATIYRHKTENKVIQEQIYDIGALGYGRHRIVELKPVLKYWVLPTEVDTTKIDKSQWQYLNEEADIKFP